MKPNILSYRGKMIPLLCILFGLTSATLVSQGISSETIELRANTFQIIGFPQSALNQTELEIKMECSDESDTKFQMAFALRSSPCDREFFDARRDARVSDLLEFYFNKETEIPDRYDYTQMVYYKSPNVTFSCKDSNGRIYFNADPNAPAAMKVVNVTKSTNRVKRDTYPGLNRNSIDGGAKNTMSSWHPVLTLPVDAIYFLVIKIQKEGTADTQPPTNVTVTITWRGPNGYLSAIDYPLLRFYTLMCVFYGVLSMVWLILCVKYYKDILRIQYWIGGVIILGMIEKAFFYSEYATMNNSGTSVEGVIQLAELISCLKRTMSRVLIIIVSVGYGVVKPRLGSTLNQVAGVGFVYFVFCAIEGLARVSKNHVEAAKQKQFADLPLVVVEMTIFYWIFTSLVSTMRTLKMRRNEVKLSVYRHFMNTLCFAVLASVIFMFWSLVFHVFPTCLKDWKELWVDTAFWHVLFCTILVVIMILWRPSNNNQRYAFTPLLDDSEDENDDELFNSAAPMFDAIKMRDTDDVRENRKAKEQRQKDDRLEEELRWIEDNIPTSLTDHLLMDEEEDKEARELERSKML